LPTPTTDFWQGVKEISRFFGGTDEIHNSLRRLVGRLRRAEIPYAIVGGMAVVAHHYRRTTDDLDVLLTPAGFAEFRRKFVPKHYLPVPRRPCRVVDRQNQVTLDVLVTGAYPGSGDPGPIAYPDPSDVAEPIRKVQVVNLATLVQLKLAARRFQDFADVVHLIRANELDESFAKSLHRSVRGDYIECLEEKRREDEYEQRRGSAAPPEE
jgi:hypothetical protein